MRSKATNSVFASAPKTRLSAATCSAIAAGGLVLFTQAPSNQTRVLAATEAHIAPTQLAAPPPGHPSKKTEPDFLPRLLAFLIDGAIVAGMFSLIEPFFPKMSELRLEAVKTVLTAGAFAAYYLITNGQTIGKRLFNLRIVRIDGEPLTWKEAGLRAIFQSNKFLGFSWFYSFFDEDSRYLHDVVAGTTVISTE